MRTVRVRSNFGWKKSQVYTVFPKSTRRSVAFHSFWACNVTDQRHLLHLLSVTYNTTCLKKRFFVVFRSLTLNSQRSISSSSFEHWHYIPKEAFLHRLSVTDSTFPRKRFFIVFQSLTLHNQKNVFGHWHYTYLRKRFFIFCWSRTHWHRVPKQTFLCPLSVCSNLPTDVSVSVLSAVLNHLQVIL